MNLHSYCSRNKGVCQYFFEEGFVFGCRAIDDALGADVLCVDEIGSLELEGKGFANIFEILDMRSGDRNLIVVRKKVLHKYEKRLNSDTVMYDVTEDNRDSLDRVIIDLILK